MGEVGRDGDPRARTGLGAAAAALLVAPACLIVPRTSTHVYELSRAEGPAIAEAPGPIEVSAGPRGGGVGVFVSRARMCRRPAHVVERVVTAHGPGAASPDEPVLFVLGMVLAPVTLPVSALVTAIVLAGARDDEARRERDDAGAATPCPLAEAGAMVRVRWPSGAVEARVTGADGAIALPVPAAEPARGVATVEVEPAAPVAVTYDRDACAATSPGPGCPAP